MPLNEGEPAARATWVKLVGGGVVFVDGDLGTGFGLFGFFEDFFGAGEGGEDVGGDEAVADELGEAFFALVEGFIGAALFGEAGAGGEAAVFEGGVDIASEEGGDVDFDFFASGVGFVDFVAVDGAGLILGEHDGDFRADAGAGGAVGLAVVVVLDLDFVVLANAIDVEEAEGEALHAVGAAGVVDDREPGFPFAGLVHGALATEAFDQGEDGVAIEVGDVAGFDGGTAGGVFKGGRLAIREAAEEEEGVVGIGGFGGGGVGGDAGDGVALIEEGGEDFEAGFRGEGDGALAFVKDDFEGAGGVGDHLELRNADFGMRIGEETREAGEINRWNGCGLGIF